MTRKINWPILIASMVISLFLWATVGAQTSQVRIISVDVKSQGADTERFFIRSLPESINATLRGTTSQINAVSTDSIEAYVDLTNAKTGRNEYPIRIFPEQARQLVTEFPRTVTVEMEAIVQRDVAVTVETSGEMSEPGYVIEKVSSDPSRVTIRGPKTEVDQIEKVRAVLPLGPVDPRRTAPYPLDVIALTKENRPMQFVRCIPLQVGVTPFLGVASVDKSVFVNGRITGQPAPGFQVSDYVFDPPQVSITGSSSRLARISKIDTEMIDISGLSGTTTVEVTLDPPMGVRVQPRSVRATVRIEAKRGVGPAPAPTTGGTPAPNPNPTTPTTTAGGTPP